MEAFDPAAVITTALEGLTANFAIVAPVAVALALGPFAVKWLLSKGKSIGK